jgi:hypothetical protein
MADTKTAQSHAEKVLDYVEATGAILEKSAAMLAQKEAQDKQCAKLIPLAVEALLSNGRIEPHEKDAAAKILGDPSKVLEVLIKTAAHRNDAERAKIGEPDQKGQTKKASTYSSLNDGYVGRRSRPEEPESYKALKKGLGL